MGRGSGYADGRRWYGTIDFATPQVVLSMRSLPIIGSSLTAVDRAGRSIHRGVRSLTLTTNSSLDMKCRVWACSATAATIVRRLSSPLSQISRCEKKGPSSSPACYLDCTWRRRRCVHRQKPRSNKRVYKPTVALLGIARKLPNDSQHNHKTIASI